jgi:hypothetical protein
VLVIPCRRRHVGRVGHAPRIRDTLPLLSSNRSWILRRVTHAPYSVSPLGVAMGGEFCVLRKDVRGVIKKIWIKTAGSVFRRG